MTADNMPTSRDTSTHAASLDLTPPASFAPAPAPATSDAAQRSLAATLRFAQQHGHQVGHRAKTGGGTDAGAGTHGNYGAGAAPHGNFGSGNSGSGSGFGAGDTFSRQSQHSKWSSSHPDKRDPKNLSALLADTVSHFGWQRKITGGRIINSWGDIMGEEIAAHSHVEKLDEDGTLYIRTDTTAWATQLRLLQAHILAELGKHYGKTVRLVRITGPNRPSWRKGPRHVKGRGPRDTYG